MDEIAGLHEVDWDSRSDVLKFLEHAVRLRDEYGLDSERQAEINTAWYNGHQQCFWNPEKKRLERQDNPNNRVRLTYNLMAGLIDGYVAKLGLSWISLQSQPQTDDLEDYTRARRQTKILQHYENLLSLRDLVKRCDKSAILSGETFIKTVWNAQAGEEVGNLTPADVGLDDEEFRKVTKGKRGKIRTGDLAVVTIPIYNIFWGPPSVPFEHAEWVLEVYERSVSYCAARYGIDPKKVTANPPSNEQVRVIQPGESTAFGQSARDRDRATVVVRELWVAANEALPGLERGRHCVSVSEEVVQNGPNPYEHQQIPIVRWVVKDVDGAVRGTTFVSDMLPPQADLNRSISQFCENRELMANPVWLVQQFAVVDESEWTGAAGGMRRYRGALPPKLEPGQTMPAAVILMIDKAEQALQKICGLRDASVGKNPPGVRSATGLSVLKEGDDERMADVNSRRVAAWKRVGYFMLSTLRQFVKEERVARIMGDSRRSQTLRWLGSDVGRSDIGVSPYDVRVDTGGNPRSRSARLADLDRLMERGFMNPQDPEDKARVLAITQDDDREPIDPKADAREMQHERNQQMTKGAYLAPAHWEDCETMLAVMREYQNKPFYRELGEEVQALFDQYEIDLKSIMALRVSRETAIAQEALVRAGVIPPPQPGAPQPQTMPGPGPSDQAPTQAPAGPPAPAGQPGGM